MLILRELNELGYGRDPNLKVDLVYNVSGPFLPPDQHELEELYRHELERDQHVSFNNLYAFNNYALGRFAIELKSLGKFDYYLGLLSENYNAAVIAKMMCRTQINVDYDGSLYDCEVNHVLGLPLRGPHNVRDIVDTPLPVREIVTSPICYSCAAGCGSSCGGSLMEKYGND
jgi:arsenite methyltransferase